MNHPVEQYTWNLMRALMLELDPDRAGWCIDAGVGRFDFYFEWMHRLGYEVVAVDPIWYPEAHEAMRLCGKRAIYGVLGNRHDYPFALYTSESRDIYSIETFWGVMELDMIVESWTVAAVVDTYNIPHITALKLDIEGAEPTVIATLPNLPVAQLPLIISFEWGGERAMREGIGAWSHEQQHRVQSAFDTLKRLGYGNGLIIGSTGDTDVFMRPIERGTPEPFEPSDNWGNAVLTRGDVSIERMMAYAEVTINP